MADMTAELGITEDDFNNWKHHPVTKVYLQFIKHYEAQVEGRMVADLRGHTAAPDAFALGSLVGYANAIRDLGEPKFASIADFYTPPNEEQ